MPLSKTELLARALLRHYLPRERFQYNVRPDWLKYPPTGRNLELDILLPDKQVAVEVQGVQHGRYIEGMQQDFTYFITQQRRDMFKREACARCGFTLLSLTSFDLQQDRFERLIRPLLAESEWRQIDPPTELYRQAERLTRMRVVRRRPARSRRNCLLKGLWSAILSKR